MFREDKAALWLTSVICGCCLFADLAAVMKAQVPKSNLVWGSKYFGICLLDYIIGWKDKRSFERR